MVSDRLLSGMNRVHRFVIRVTGGRLGWQAGRMPVLELTTTGRRSGQPRSLLLTVALVLDDTYVVVASRGGDDRHPAWYLNLVEHPEVEVSIKGRPRERRRARVASAGERAELWPRVERSYRGYRAYQRRTSRQIPLVLLEPI
ncbi:MAG TPA: nitroreductase/quinone reductase family protein [Rhodoglobus sp.]|nr:nitroreductase/quinone reductase family protein [Rhodoglobus sp.]